MHSFLTLSFVKVYEVAVNDIDGKAVDMSIYKGNVLLISNVASFCGLTKCSYVLFKELIDKYHDSGLRILLFPCNQFARQEPGSAEEIKQFVRHFSEKFDLFEKVKVNGDETHPLFQYLKKQCPGTLVNAIKWNFTKVI